jgi:hypothetical protein
MAGACCVTCVVIYTTHTHTHTRPITVRYHRARRCGHWSYGPVPRCCQHDSYSLDLQCLVLKCLLSLHLTRKVRVDVALELALLLFQTRQLLLQVRNALSFGIDDICVYGLLRVLGHRRSLQGNGVCSYNTQQQQQSIQQVYDNDVSDNSALVSVSSAMPSLNRMGSNRHTFPHQSTATVLETRESNAPSDATIQGPSAPYKWPQTHALHRATIDCIRDIRQETRFTSNRSSNRLASASCGRCSSSTMHTCTDVVNCSMNCCRRVSNEAGGCVCWSNNRAKHAANCSLVRPFNDSSRASECALHIARSRALSNS